ncbi:anti-sigma factor domain-containing protein [Roseovarius sp. SYSU LYC5161]|uniref:anti-sigma factor n=1 Tax=Roseovarius halophilus (ex Wu et al. 2025) TaxID=3376060 RepID=UPI003999AF06
MSDQEHPDRDDDVVLAGEYALGLLTPEEATVFEERLANEPDLRQLHAQWAEDFTALAEEVSPVTPPSRVRKKLENRLFQKAGQSFWQRLARSRLAGAATAAALALVALVLVDLPSTGPMPPDDPVYHADIVSEDGNLVVAAGYDDTNGELYVERSQGAARPGRALELWLIAGDKPPVSLGVLPETERARLPVEPDLRTALDGGVFAISDEPPGGSPKGAPTGDVLAVGEITRL